MKRYRIYITNLGRKKANLTLSDIYENEIENKLYKYCKPYLMSDNILFMENGDIVAGFHKVGEFRLEVISK